MLKACRLVLTLAVSVFLACSGPASGVDDGWIPLFNGKNLDGWRVKIRGYEVGDNYADTFRVEDGLLRVVYDDYEEFDGKFGHLFFETPFSHYRLRVEYRFVGQQTPGGPGWAFRNSGVMLHGQSPESMTVDQEFPVSIEAQMLGGDGEHERSTGNLCTPGTHVEMDGELVTRHCTNSSSATYHGDGWVTMEQPKIDTVAESLGMSGRSLQRALSEEGRSFRDLLNEAQFKQGVRLLADPVKTVTDIALELGYGETSGFSRAFARIAGMSPREYRRRILTTDRGSLSGGAERKPIKTNN